MPKKPLSLVKQVEKIQSDRTYLRSVIQTMVAVARDVPGQISPPIVKQLQDALDQTANEDGT